MSKNLFDKDAFKSFKKWVPLKDKLLILGLPTLFTLLAAGAALTPQEWTAAKIGVFAAAVLGLWVGAFFWLRQKINAAPTFETRHGIMVWTNGLPISQDMMEKATEHYMISMMAAGLAKKSAVAGMFDGMRVEWAPKPYKIKWFGGEYIMVNGSARPHNRAIKVVWRGAFHRNAFFHECSHLVRQLVMGREPDYDHKDDQVWDLVSQMKVSFGKQYEGM